MDDAGIAWVWGRDDLGQLGMEFTHGVREGRKVCIFAPNPNPQIPKVPCAISAEPSVSSYVVLVTWYYITFLATSDKR